MECQANRKPVITETGIGSSTRNRTDSEKSGLPLVVREQKRGSPWPERNAELLGLATGPERLTNQQICDRMGLRKGQIDWGLSLLRAGGAAIERERKEPPPPLPSTHPLFGVTDDWTVEKIALLRALWPDLSLGTIEIGRRVGVSKNAAVGKAHRLGLAARPSPIRRRGGDSPPNPTPTPTPPAPRHTLPPLRSVASGPRVPKRIPPLALNRPLASAPRPEPAVTHPAPKPSGRIVSCCWPIGTPGTRAFHFCEGPSLPGCPYCEPHAKKAYLSVRGHASPQAGTGAELSGAGP